MPWHLSTGRYIPWSASLDTIRLDTCCPAQIYPDTLHLGHQQKNEKLKYIAFFTGET